MSATQPATAGIETHVEEPRISTFERVGAQIVDSRIYKRMLDSKYVAFRAIGVAGVVGFALALEQFEQGNGGAVNPQE